MSFGTALVAIVAILAFAAIRIARYKSEGSRHPLPRDEQDLAVRDREIAELRERVKVLERIATDSHTGPGRDARAIAEEIEGLRGPEPVHKGDAR